MLCQAINLTPAEIGVAVIHPRNHNDKKVGD
jgi:hypothetical protein